MRLVLSALAVLLLVPAVALRAQDAPSPDAPPPPSKAPAQAEEPLQTGQTLKVNVNLVDVYFSVRDKNGFVQGLTKDDCQIAEDKTPQTIKNLTQEKNLPLTIGILLDTSGSQERVLPMEQESGARFLREVIKPKDEAFLISINEASSSAGIPGIGGGPLPTGRQRGTLLYDAVYLAAHDKLQSQAGRKIIVLLTDGGDQGSQETLKSATEAAQRANAIIYVILLSDPRYSSGYGMFGGAAAMRQLAADTGGRVINVGLNGRKLEDAFDQIQDELRTQYLLSYTPANKDADGKYRKIEINCGKGMDVQARKGYYAVVGDENNN
jgi:hypothetical protein